MTLPLEVAWSGRRSPMPAAYLITWALSTLST